MQRQSEQVLVRLTSAEEVEASAKTHGPGVGQALDARFEPARKTPEGETLRLPFGEVIFLFKEDLAGSREHLATADHAHVMQLRKVIELRQERDGLFGTIYDQLGTSRRTIEEVFGKGQAFVLAGIESPTARKPSKLLSQAKLAITRLSDPELELPTPRIEGVTVDAAKMAGGLRTGVDTLEGVVAELRDQRRVAQGTRLAKNRALAAHDNTFLWISRTLEGYYQLAGEPELAAQIRPSQTRPGRRAVEVLAESAPEEVPAEAPAEEPEATESSVTDEPTA